ncbi:MAG: hypothetical protein GY937_05650 [bacterium]|nr:hypothetical protein [bacterium]
MGFVFETGNAGLQKAVQGAAAGLETARRVQDQQQAREMAMTELQLRQQQSEMAMDAFSERLRHNRAQEARGDLRLTAEIEDRQASRTLTQQKFALVTSQDKQARDLQEQRGEADALLLKAMGDDSEITQEESDLLVDSLEGFDPGVRSRIMSRVKDMQMRKDAEARAQSLRDLSRSEQFVMAAGRNEAEKQAIAMEMAEAQHMFHADPEGYAERVREVEGRVLQENGLRTEIARWVSESSVKIDAAITDEGEKDEAHLLRQQIAEIGEVNPSDPRISQYKERIAWLSTPKSVRAAVQVKDGLLKKAQRTLELIGMGDSEQITRIDEANQVQRGVLARGYGERHSANQEARGRELTAALKVAGYDPKLDVLVPVDTAIPQLKEFAYRQIQDFTESVKGADLDVGTEVRHITALAERSGLLWNEDAQDEYEAWLLNPGMLDLREIDPDLVYEANIYKDKERKAGRTTSELAKKNADEKWMKAFLANEKARKAGLPQVDIGDPPKSIAREAKKAGWVSAERRKWLDERAAKKARENEERIKENKKSVIRGRSRDIKK